MNIIKTEGLEYVYPDGTRALKGISIDIENGTKAAFVGNNGAGKSTLFLHLNGILKPARGKVTIEGNPIKYDRKSLINLRKKVGMVFQDPDDQLFAPVVRQDVAFGPDNLDLPKDEVDRRVKYALKAVGMEAYADKPPHFLSGGQKKRVAIAGVLAMEPEVLVLDEPTAGLDPRGSADVLEILEELNAEGRTVVFSTHDIDLAAAWADSVYVLSRGKVVRSGNPKSIFGDEKLIAEAGLKHPVVVQTFREFRARGISNGDVPISILDFMDSVDVKVMNIRCAIAGCDVSAGDEVCIEIKNGMLIANKGSNGVTGRAVFDGKKGEDIAVRDVAGDILQHKGNITVIRVPGIIEGGSRAADLDRVRDILSKNKHQKMGAMGTSAKVLMNRLGIRCDFEFDVIQSGILAALRGFDVTILASGGMADRVAEKVKERKLKYSCFVL